MAEAQVDEDQLRLRGGGAAPAKKKAPAAKKKAAPKKKAAAKKKAAPKKKAVKKKLMAKAVKKAVKVAKTASAQAVTKTGAKAAKLGELAQGVVSVPAAALAGLLVGGGLTFALFRPRGDAAIAGGQPLLVG